MEGKRKRLGIEQVTTENAPAAIGPYSQAVRAGQFLFVSGQLGLDPVTGKVAGETIEEQTNQVLKNMEAILHVQGLSFENVVRTEIYLKNLSDFKVVNALYAEKFTQEVKPSRQTMQVAMLPLDVLVEISCIAFYLK